MLKYSTVGIRRKKHFGLELDSNIITIHHDGDMNVGINVKTLKA